MPPAIAMCRGRRSWLRARFRRAQDGPSRARLRGSDSVTVIVAAAAFPSRPEPGEEQPVPAWLDAAPAPRGLRSDARPDRLRHAQPGPDARPDHLRDAQPGRHAQPDLDVLPGACPPSHDCPRPHWASREPPWPSALPRWVSHALPWLSASPVRACRRFPPFPWQPESQAWRRPRPFPWRPESLALQLHPGFPCLPGPLLPAWLRGRPSR